MIWRDMGSEQRLHYRTGDRKQGIKEQGRGEMRRQKVCCVGVGLGRSVQGAKCGAGQGM